MNVIEIEIEAIVLIEREIEREKEEKKREKGKERRRDKKKKRGKKEKILIQELEKKVQIRRIKKGVVAVKERKIERVKKVLI